MKFRALLLPAILLSFSQPALADDYPTCKSSCNSDYAACMKSIAGTTPQETVADNAACESALEACYMQCKEIQTGGTGTQKQ